MTSTANTESPACRLPLLFDMRLCLVLPFAFMAMFWACSALDTPTADTGRVIVDQPALVRPHHPAAATIR